MKYDVITIGGVVEDISFHTNEGVIIDNKKDLLRQKLLAFEYGAKIKIDKVDKTFGGGAANTAVCFSRLGLKTACMASIGADERGKRLLNNFKKEKVATEFIYKSKLYETAYSFILVGPSNEHIVFSNRGANQKLEVRSEKLEKSKWLFVSSLSGNWKKDLAEIFKAKNVKIAWNPGHRQLIGGIKVLKPFLAKTNVLIVNKDEALEICLPSGKLKGRDNACINDTENLLNILKSFGPKIVVITEGAKGAKCYDGQKIYTQKAIKKKVQNTTGVGDAFGSSFVAGLELYKGDIVKSLKLAALNSASVVSHLGAQTGLLKLKVRS
jgi:ribokinase